MHLVTRGGNGVKAAAELEELEVGVRTGWDSLRARLPGEATSASEGSRLTRLRGLAEETDGSATKQRQRRSVANKARSGAPLIFESAASLGLRGLDIAEDEDEDDEEDDEDDSACVSKKLTSCNIRELPTKLELAARRRGFCSALNLLSEPQRRQFHGCKDQKQWINARNIEFSLKVVAFELLEASRVSRSSLQ